MNRKLLPLACILPILVSCSGGNLAPTAASLTPVALSPAQIAKVQQTCQVAGPMLAVAADPSMPATVAQTATYGDAYCRQLLAGSVPSTTDSNTPSWLPRVVEGVQIAAAVARVALPIILPLL